MGALCLNGHSNRFLRLLCLNAIILEMLVFLGFFSIHTDLGKARPAFVLTVSATPLTGVEMKDRRISDTQARRKIAEIIRLSRAAVAAGFRNPVEDYDHGRLPVALMRDYDVFFDKWGTPEDGELCRGTAKN